MATQLELLLFIGGILHLGMLTAGAALPVVLDWRMSLQKLDALSREVIWVHYAFIGLVIIGFGAVSLLFAGQLAAGDPLARAVCLLIGLFWTLRLLIQFFVFQARPYLSNALLKFGYHGLTIAFGYFAVVYSLAALLPR